MKATILLSRPELWGGRKPSGLKGLNYKVSFVFSTSESPLILEINKSQVKDIAVLVLRGSIHTGPDCRRVEHEVEELLNAGKNGVIFDLAGVTHIDSAAIGVVVRCYAKLKKSGGMLRLAGCCGMVDKAIGMFPTVAAAAENFPQSS